MFDNIWTEKYRPSSLSQIVLTEDNRKHFEAIKDEIPNLLFEGRPGIGKTSMAKIIVNSLLDAQYLYINASDENGIDTIRHKVVTFAQTKSIDGKLKVILLDEVDGLTADAQKALRNTMEEYTANVRFILTCNYVHKIINALRSRCQSYDLTPPLEGCAVYISNILKAENVRIPKDEHPKLIKLVKSNYPDLRQTINELQKNIIDGVLQISEESNKEGFADKIWTKLQEDYSVFELRKFIISNEATFSNDYNSLLKQLFEVVYESKVNTEKKQQGLLIIADHLYKDAFVMDKEINAYACLINLKGIL